MPADVMMPVNRTKVIRARHNQIIDGNLKDGTSVQFVMFNPLMLDGETCTALRPRQQTELPHLNADGEIEYEFSGGCRLLRRPPKGFSFQPNNGTLEQDEYLYFDTWLVSKN